MEREMCLLVLLIMIFDNSLKQDKQRDGELRDIEREADEYADKLYHKLYGGILKCA